MPLMKDMFDFTPVSSWVENFNESTHDSASRTRIFESFVMLPEVEKSARIILDRIHRKQGRGFFITGLYGSGKTIFMAWLSAILTEPTLRKQFLDTKPEWGMDALAPRKFLTVNFTAIEVPDETLEQAFWNSVTDHLRHLSSPATATLSNTDAYLDTFFNHTASGTRSDVENWIRDNRNLSVDQLRSYDKEYQKTIIEQAVAALNIQLVQDRTTVTEKVKKLVEIARARGYEGVQVFIDELYLHLIQSDEHFNRGTAFLGQLAEAGLAGDQPFWIFGAVQEEIQAIARQAGRNYDTELMGKLSGQSGRFQSINIPVTQFHRIYNHPLFRENFKCVHKLADAFKAEIQPHFRGAFADFLKRYFREREPITDEAKHFADVYPMHPFGLYCLTAITNRGGRSRGALGFVQEFIERHLQDTSDWKRIAVLDDVFDYEDLRNKIIQDDPEMAKYYGMFERFCSTARDEVLSRVPYKRWSDADQAAAKVASERLIKALIVLSMVKEELTVSKLNDALLLRWPGKESDPAGSDQETARILEKIGQTFPPLRQKGSGDNLSFFLSVEGDGGEREELLKDSETCSRHEFGQAEQSLQTWSGASVPDAISDWVDIFALPKDGKESRVACYASVRGALRDMLGRAEDDDIEAANRYSCVEEFAHRVREARDFLDRISELASLAGKLRELKALGVPPAFEKSCQELEGSIEAYVKSAGTSGEMSRITAEWKDLHESYLNQDLSEHAGLHKDLKALRDAVFGSASYQVLKDLSRVERLSAHFSPGFIESQLTDLLTHVGVQQVCEQSLDNLKRDLSHGWVCSVCGYKPGKRLDLKPNHFLELVERGIKEYLDHVRGCEAELRDYVSDTPAANPLLGLLGDPAEQSALDALQDATMRQHLAEALAEAEAEKIKVDELLEKLKPKLLGFYKTGEEDFSRKFADSVREELAPYRGRVPCKPWKVE